MKLILLLLLVPLVHSFHVTRNTEIGLCTITDSNKHAHKFSCLQGDRNYCCGGRDNQSCCTVDEVRHFFTIPLFNCLPLSCTVCKSAQNCSDPDIGFPGAGRRAVRTRGHRQHGHHLCVHFCHEAKEEV